MAETRTQSFTYEVLERAELAEDEAMLLQAAQEALEQAYEPYSRFRVGCALLLNTGEIIIGANQENASYGLTMCAERVALNTAGSQGRTGDIRKIAVVGSLRDHENDQIVAPCGACRQVMRESEDRAGEPFVILMAGIKGEVYRVVGVERILPFSFGPKDLGMEVVS